MLSGCSLGLVFGLVLFGLMELDPFDRSRPSRRYYNKYDRNAKGIS